MAINNTELFGTKAGTVQKRFRATSIRPKRFVNVGGAPKLLAGTPVAYDTSIDKWKAFTNGGANGVGTIRGFVWPDDIQLHATDDVIGNVIMEGTVHRDDVELNGETQNNVDAALVGGTPSLRELNIEVEGVTKVR